MKWGQKLNDFGAAASDTIAKFGSSWRFILSFCGGIAVWISINTWVLNNPVDPYPYILLNLCLSWLAGVQAPIIMMSQRRQEERDKQKELARQRYEDQQDKMMMDILEAIYAILETIQSMVQEQQQEGSDES